MKKQYTFIDLFAGCGGLSEGSNDMEKKNKETLLGYFRRANRVEVYTKHDSWAKDGWPKLADWSTDDDVLFLLDGTGFYANEISVKEYRKKREEEFSRLDNDCSIIKWQFSKPSIVRIVI